MPSSTHTVIIPDGNPYDPQLTSDVSIASMTIQTGGQLSLNEYDITISSDVYIHGSLICSNTEQIALGGNWSAYSGATVTASSSTVTFNGTGSYNILSSGTTFYNLAFSNNVSTWTLTDALYSAGDFTITTSSGNVDSNSKDLTVAGDFTINGGKFTAGASTITVAGNWDTSVSDNAFTYDTSTVYLIGTGNLKTTGGWWDPHFYNLSVSSATKTTTILSHVTVADTLKIGSGTLTGPSYYVTLRKNNGTPLSLDSGAEITLSRIVYRPESGTVTVTGGDYGTLDYLLLYSAGSDVSFNLGGNITVIGTFWLITDAGNPVVCNTQDKNITATQLKYGDSSVNGSATFNCQSSTITIGAGGLSMANNGGSHTLNLSSATVTCAGNWMLSNGTGSIAQDPGISTVTLDGTSGTQSVTSNGQSFHNLTINNTGTSVELEDALDVDGNLTITAGTLDTKSGENNPINVAGNWAYEGGAFECRSSTVTFDNATSTSTLTGSTTFYGLVSTASGKLVKFSSSTITYATGYLNFENITLRSTLDNATWYLNLSGTQDVHHVNVRDSNASDGKTIYAGSSTDLGNNTNWVFDDWLLTWDGDVDNDWNEPENWNFSIVPLSTHTVIIPNVDNDPQLTSDVNIASITIQTGGQLSLNEYDITISSDVYIHGSLICSNTEQITLGGNWAAYSGATVTASSSTVTFNGNGSFNILSSGTTFYNLAFNNSVGTWTLTDALYVKNDFTQLNGTFDTNSSGNYPLTIGDDITISGGTFYARVSTITLTGSNSDGSADWDSYGGTFTYGTSTVDLKETGTVKGSETSPAARPFYNLTCAYPGKTTTLITTGIGVNGILTVQGGILTKTGGSISIYLRKTPGTPISIVNGSTITVSSLKFHFDAQNVPAYDYDTILAKSSDGTATQIGNVTCTGLDVTGDNFANRSPTWDTGGYTLTVNGNLLVGSQYSGLPTGTHTFAANGSTITVSGYVKLDHPNAYLDLDTSNMRVAGNWTITDGNVVPDTSSVTFYGAGTSTSTLTGSTTFYVLISTTTGKNVEFSSDTLTGVTGHLNFENITLHSTLDGATWYLNLTGTQDVSGVDVRDSNASGGNTIVDFDCPDIEGCYYGNNTNWDFGPPAAITDLNGQCDSDTGDVTLSWSTPGDDEWTGTLVQGAEGSKYRIDYSTYVIAWSTNTYDVDIPTHSVTPYTEVSHTITGLTGGTSYYFRIWTADEIPLWSGLSNGATVWVNPILSVSISTDTYNFGELNASTAAVSTANITVTNDGNVMETYSIKCSSTTKWTPDNTPGNDKFTSQAAFHPSQPNNDDIDWKSDDILTESLQPCTTAAFSIDNSQSGKNVQPFTSNIRDFWLRIKTPLSTSTTTQQTITITISAEQGSP
ncbi:MAG: fibronectin type III domain-containing protein [Candidatus Bathyarchaeota archaeon]|nr:fibronectin type III domain-containing protein [Candidatus Bathyarchaeota archaeon]